MTSLMIIIHLVLMIITIPQVFMTRPSPLDVTLDFALVFLLLKSCPFHTHFHDEVTEAWGG